MTPANHYDEPPSETLKRLADDMWYKPDAVTKRLGKVEADMAGVLKFHTDLEGPPGSYESGILGRMNASLNRFSAYLDRQTAVDEERKRAEDGRWWKTALGAGAAMFVVNVIWSLIKAKLGIS